MNSVRGLVCLSPRLVGRVGACMKSGERGSYLKCWKTSYSSSASPGISVSSPEGQVKDYDPKIVGLVGQISKLTLLEVSDLNELLKRTLNIPDVPMMSGSFGPSQAQAAEEEEEVVPQKVQTSFTVKLLKYEDGKKVALIKEIKGLLEGFNLVQAKKFVESAPTTVKADIGKEDAEKLAAALTAAGATCEII